MARLMRRLAPAAALGGLAVVIVGLVDPALASRNDAAQALPQNPGTDTTVAQSAPQGSSMGSSMGSGTAQSAPQGSSTDAGQSTTATCDIGQTFTGPVVTTRWGPVQVEATVANGQLCSVRAVAWPDGDPRSSMISQYVIPQLDAMASQSGTQFDTISGATYTSEGYRQSLQQLLDSM